MSLPWCVLAIDLALSLKHCYPQIAGLRLPFFCGFLGRWGNSLKSPDTSFCWSAWSAPWGSIVFWGKGKAIISLWEVKQRQFLEVTSGVCTPRHSPVASTYICAVRLFTLISGFPVWYKFKSQQTLLKSNFVGAFKIIPKRGDGDLRIFNILNTL